jgi:nucleoside-diphosphate-sugar epimerase
MADVSRARDELGYEIVVGFEDGLARTIEHYVALAESPTPARA